MRILSEQERYDEEAKKHLVQLIDYSQRRLQTTRTNARCAVARAMRVPPGTLENVERGRLKRGVGGWLGRLFITMLIAELERQQRAIGHEMELLRQRGSDPRSPEWAAVEADFAVVVQMRSELN